MPLESLIMSLKRLRNQRNMCDSLDLENAYFTSKFKNHETVYTSRMFISNPAKALVIRITSNGPETDLRVELDSKVSI